MPSSDPWISTPLLCIDSLFATHGPEYDPRVFFEDKLQHDWASVPSLNDVPLHAIAPGSLVRFRGMVQDMFDPEYFLDTFQLRGADGSLTTRSGRYRESFDLPEGAAMADAPEMKYGERQCVVCVPIPAETSWAKEAYCMQWEALVPAAVGRKRELDDDDVDESGAEKRVRGEHQGAAAAVSSPLEDMFPLPGERGTAVLVKLYQGQPAMRILEVHEIVGILSLESEPAVASGFHEEAHPPAAVLPRLHCVAVRALAPPTRPLPPAVSAVSMRAALSCYLGAAVGDALAGEYLLLHLLSRVHTRMDGSALVLGKLSLNLSAAPPGLAPALYEAISALLPRAAQLPLTLDNMNRLRMCPKKDFTRNRLRAGALQLAGGTVLVLDETAMAPGKLEEAGVHNLRALHQLVLAQTVEYDFHYHTLPFHVDVPVLVTSEGRSLFPTDVQVPLQVSSAPPERLSPDMLWHARAYLQAIRGLDFSIPEELAKIVEADFVQMRQEDRGITGQHLHTMLALARLHALSKGEQHLSPASWAETRALEHARLQRLPRPPQE